MVLLVIDKAITIDVRVHLRNDLSLDGFLFLSKVVGLFDCAFGLLLDLLEDLLLLPFAHAIIVCDNVGELISLLLNMILVLALHVHTARLVVDKLVNARFDFFGFSRVFFLLSGLRVLGQAEDVLVGALLPPSQVDLGAEFELALNAAQDILPNLV